MLNLNSLKWARCKIKWIRLDYANGILIKIITMYYHTQTLKQTTWSFDDKPHFLVPCTKYREMKYLHEARIELSWPTATWTYQRLWLQSTEHIHRTFDLWHDIEINNKSCIRRFEFHFHTWIQFKIDISVKDFTDFTCDQFCWLILY